MKLFFKSILFLSYFLSIVKSFQSYRYGKTQKFGLGLDKRILNFHLLNRKAYEYPQPLPSPSPSKGFLHPPAPSLSQGSRIRGDERVFRKSFIYPPAAIGHQVTTENLMDCIITFLSIETKGNIPIILRGGVGYRHFTVVVRARPWEALDGTIRAYCQRTHDKL